jgi:hypothetical protein
LAYLLHIQWREISSISVELKTNVSEFPSASIIKADVVNDHVTLM